MNPLWITEREASDYLTERGHTFGQRSLRVVRSLDRSRTDKKGPPYIKVGNKVFYERGELDKWMSGRVKRF
jgi:hypothetical protein